MRSEHHKPIGIRCLCNALRQACRAVSRLFDLELRGVGMRTTQYSPLYHLSMADEVKQRDLGGLMSLDETTLTRSLGPRINSGWVAVGAGEDRREKLIRLTQAGVAKVWTARPTLERAHLGVCVVRGSEGVVRQPGVSRGARVSLPRNRLSRRQGGRVVTLTSQSAKSC
jgi:DNA-binding MarR family transcriptional regulator